MYWRCWSINAKLIFAILLLAVIPVVVVGAGLNVIHESTRQAAWLAHTHEVIESLERVLSTPKHAEAGPQGSLLTNDRDYLEPYNPDVANVAIKLTRLKAVMSDNPNQQGRIATRKPLIETKLSELQETLELRPSGQTQEVLDVVKTDRSKQAMDSIRSHNQAMAKVELVRLHHRQARFERAIGNASSGIIGFVVFGVLIGIGIAAFIIRSIVHPLRLFLTRTPHRSRMSLVALNWACPFHRNSFGS